MKKPKGFEQSKYDHDKGVKENSPADKRRDKQEMAAFKQAQAKKGKRR